VIEHANSQHPSIRLSILFFTLGVSVFFWGLGYKLSLYETHAASIHRIPQAKLLSREEDGNAREALPDGLVRPPLAPVHTHSTLLLLMSWVFVTILRMNPDRQDFFIPGPWCLRLAEIQSAFRFRPPPALC